VSDVKIFCPKCEWVPQPSDLWMCESPCGHLWNTFETGGVCPQCGRNWEDTQCLRCQAWSRHADWYHTPVSASEQEETQTLTA
jgi:hypothetical protein